VNVLTLIKGLPFGYNRDLQEDKFPVFDSIDTLQLVFPAFTGLIRTLEFNRDNLEKSLTEGHILATDIAEWLVTKGMAYRDAHEIVGRLVVLAESNNVDVAKLNMEQFNSVSEIFTEEFMVVLSIERSIESRQSPGSANRNNVLRQISKLRSL
jgi:argininosuccinate lyase